MALRKFHLWINFRDREQDQIPIEFIIRNKFSYPGGMYGEYGGYDVILFKLKESITNKFGPEVVPIFLPKDEKFPDVGPALIAGYGRYRRVPCEVGRLGPEKYEFCGVEPECTRESKVMLSLLSLLSLPALLALSE